MSVGGRMDPSLWGPTRPL